MRSTVLVPKPPKAKAKVCLNAFRHGLAGGFHHSGRRNREDFDELYEGLRAEHRPETPTEILLVESMAQHYCLLQRALRLQSFCFDDEVDATRKASAARLLQHRNSRSISATKPRTIALFTKRSTHC